MNEARRTRIADLEARTTDMGAMELYAASVIGTDPFRVADQLREGFT